MSAPHDARAAAAGRPSGRTSCPLAETAWAGVAVPAPGPVLLADAAMVLAAREQLAGLLAQLAAHPFNPLACAAMRRYLAGPLLAAQVACGRLRAAAPPVSGR